MIEVQISEVRVDEESGEQIIVLRQKDGDRLLPIVIGICEANAILFGLRREQAFRPLTHDLLINTIAAMDGKIEEVFINDLRDGTYYSELHVHTPDGTVTIDSRPSDAVALAIRARCPIFVDKQVLQTTEDDLNAF